MPPPPAGSISGKPTADGRAQTVSAAVTALLIMQGVATSTAAKLGAITAQVSHYIETHEEVKQGIDAWTAGKATKDALEGGKKMAQAGALIAKSGALPHSSAYLQGLAKVDARGGQLALSGLADLLEVAAKHGGLPLDECAMAFTKVDLDVLGMVVAAPEVVTPMTRVLFVANRVAFLKDLAAMSRSCGSTPEPAAVTKK